MIEQNGALAWLNAAAIEAGSGALLSVFWHRSCTWMCFETLFRESLQLLWRLAMASFSNDWNATISLNLECAEDFWKFFAHCSLIINPQMPALREVGFLHRWMSQHFLDWLWIPVVLEELRFEMNDLVQGSIRILRNLVRGMVLCYCQFRGLWSVEV